MESNVEQLSQTSNALPLARAGAYGEPPKIQKCKPLSFLRTVRRQELWLVVPLAERRSTKWSAALAIGTRDPHGERTCGHRLPNSVGGHQRGQGQWRIDTFG